MKKENKKQVGIRLSQNDIDYIMQIKNENSLNSMTKAFEFILREHQAQHLKQNEAIANLVMEKFESKYGNVLTRIRLASNSADKNIQIIMEILNSLFYSTFENIKFVPTDIITSQIIKESTEKINKKIAYFKQLKNNKESKK